ncbi:hypothetical protein U1Q18_020327 [Sarracenia purpurea var. burkii]
MNQQKLTFQAVESAASIGEDDGRTVDESMVVASAGGCEVVLVVCCEWRRWFRGFGPPFYNSRSMRERDEQYLIQGLRRLCLSATQRE